MICENCGKEHDGTYASGRFCSLKCARAYSTNHISRTKKKIAKCINCGKEIEVNMRANLNKVKCDTCKRRKNKCSICGREYFVDEGCTNRFCKEHNLQQIRSLVKYFGFDKTTIGTIKVEQEFNRIRNILYDMYWNKKMSGQDIAKHFNYPSGSNIVGKIMIYLNIPRRSFKDCSINAWLQGNNSASDLINQYKCGWHTTWNNKEVYLRSSYEFDYANILDQQKIEYDVECLHIKYLSTKDNEYHCAIPDFYIKDTNTIIEIKSDYTLDIQNMKDKFEAYKEQGYNCKLILEHKEVDLYSL